MSRPLRRKVWRDLRRLWPQVIAIALVLAAGVATLILGHGAHASLSETRNRYYQTARFADVFASVTRAPLSLLARIGRIDGVLTAEGRIVGMGLPDLPDLVEPGTVMLVSLPEATGLNRLYLRQGTLPDPSAPDEVAVSEGFAKAHGLIPGAFLRVTVNGRSMRFKVTGIALSPEYIYALGPGQMMPDPRRHGILWAPRRSLASVFDLQGAFSDLVLDLAPGANEAEVIAALDRVLAPYGGKGAHGRADQLSHAFLDAELRQLEAMVRVLPPIFMAVASLLVHMTFSRLVTLEREQIGMLKAIGYGGAAIAWHYATFALAIATVGVMIGWAAGAMLGIGIAQMYARFFSFPFLVFANEPRLYGLAALVSAGSALSGAAVAVRRAAILPPAVAMAPPMPVSYGRSFATGSAIRRKTGVMMLRHLLRWPGRSASSVLGSAMAVSLLVASLWSFGSIDRMIDITFQRGERQDVRLVFTKATGQEALYSVRHMPGVLTIEPFRIVETRISLQGHSKRVAIVGRPESPDLSRILDPDLRPMAMPDAGLILSEALAAGLGARRGDFVQVELLEGSRSVLTLPVSGISLGYVGLGASMRIDALNRLLCDGPLVSGVDLLIDPARREAFFTAAKAAPQTRFASVTALTVGRFRETLAENIIVMITVYVCLASIVAVGVVYNFARIALSELGRELATLRVLGLTAAEVAAVPLGELAVIVILAQPLGWLIGYGIGWVMVLAFSSDLYRVPFWINRDVYAIASLVVCGAAFLSALAVRGRIAGLDMITVLKTRE